VLRAIRETGVALDDDALRGLSDGELWARLVAFAGVGPKTAACVLLFSLGRPFFPVDTHVHRVAVRLGLVPRGANAVVTQALLQRTVPEDLMYELHMELIRHGRHVCVARRPICSECVLRDICPRVGVTESR
jgi:endonuclease-3